MFPYRFAIVPSRLISPNEDVDTAPSNVEVDPADPPSGPGGPGGVRRGRDGG